MEGQKNIPRGNKILKRPFILFFNRNLKSTQCIYKPSILKRFRAQQKMERTGWIWVTSCLVVLVASQGCPDKDLNLKRWSDDATWNGQVQKYIFHTLNFVYVFWISV